MHSIKELTVSQDSVRENALEELFKNMPDETDCIVSLPSRCKFYKSQGPVKVSALKFEDEQRILTGRNKKENIINQLISKCVEGVTLNELLPMDKFYLILKIREISYGDMYKFEVVCPICGNSTNVELNPLQHLNINEVPDDMEDPRTVMLPKLKVPALVRFQRGSDEDYTLSVEDTLQNLHRFVVSINNNDDPVFIAKALKKMHIQDLKVISKEINRNDLGVDPRFTFECQHCTNTSLVTMPLDANFFSVN